MKKNCAVVNYTLKTLVIFNWSHQMNKIMMLVFMTHSEILINIHLKIRSKYDK